MEKEQKNVENCSKWDCLVNVCTSIREDDDLGDWVSRSLIVMDDKKDKNEEKKTDTKNNKTAVEKKIDTTLINKSIEEKKRIQLLEERLRKNINTSTNKRLKRTKTYYRTIKPKLIKKHLSI